MICILIYDCLGSGISIFVSVHYLVEMPFLHISDICKSNFNESSDVIPSTLMRSLGITTFSCTVREIETSPPLFRIMTWKFIRLGIHVTIFKPSNGCSSVIFKNIFQNNRAAICIVKMIIVGIIGNSTIHIDIKQIVQKDVEQKRTHDGPLWYIAIYRGTITEFTHNFDSLAPVFKVTNNHITSIIRQTISMQFSNWQIMWHPIKCLREVNCDGARYMAVIKSQSPVLGEFKNNMLAVMTFSVGWQK